MILSLRYEAHLMRCLVTQALVAIALTSFFYWAWWTPVCWRRHKYGDRPPSPPEFSCNPLSKVWDCMHSRVSASTASLLRGNCLYKLYSDFCTSGRWGAIATNRRLCGYFALNDEHTHTEGCRHSHLWWLFSLFCSSFSQCGFLICWAEEPIR